MPLAATALGWGITIVLALVFLGFVIAAVQGFDKLGK